ncbi:MAG: anaerobic ribonucleoside-triphosphate reductase activating protein [archaeon]|nr:anaerobic ribonucleoside-triphosphate reductase activating protein [archaeon]
MEIVAFIPKSTKDWPGKICSTVLVPGCNFRCPYCFTHSLVLFDKKLPRVSEQKFFETLLKSKGKVEAVTITGGEPLIQGAELAEFCERIQMAGFQVRLCTNGSNPELIEELIHRELVDYFALDIKTSFNPRKYFELTNKLAILNRVRKSVQLVKRYSKDYEFITTLVPGIVSEKDILSLAFVLQGSKRFVLQQFQKSSGTLSPEFENIVETPYEYLLKVAEKIQGMEEVRIRTIKGDEVISSKKTVQMMK